MAKRRYSSASVVCSVRQTRKKVVDVVEEAVDEDSRMYEKCRLIVCSV